MIEAEASIDIERPADAVFAHVCDLSRAPQWLQGCVSMELAPPGVWRVGAELNSVHRQGGHELRMEGVVAEHRPGRALRLEFADGTFAVTVDLRMTDVPGGTHVAHVVTIELKSFALRLMAPMIRVANQQQVAGNLENLKRELEAIG